jgi:hypothetical protein
MESIESVKGTYKQLRGVQSHTRHVFHLKETVDARLGPTRSPVPPLKPRESS